MNKNKIINIMPHFLKITKNKVKLFFFFIFIIILFSCVSVFLTSIIARRAGLENFQEQIITFSNFFGILYSLLVPYILLVFLKKKFFLKKYFTEFTKIFFIFYIARELIGIIPTLLYKILSIEIFLSNPIQVIGFISHFIIYYIAICFIDKVDKVKVEI